MHDLSVSLPLLSLLVWLQPLISLWSQVFKTLCSSLHQIEHFPWTSSVTHTYHWSISLSCFSWVFSFCFPLILAGVSIPSGLLFNYRGYDNHLGWICSLLYAYQVVIECNHFEQRSGSTVSSSTVDIMLDIVFLRCMTAVTYFSDVWVVNSFVALVFSSYPLRLVCFVSIACLYSVWWSPIS